MRSSGPGRLLFINQVASLSSAHGGNSIPPQACGVATGMWTLAEAANYIAEGRWPSSYFTITPLSDVELKCVNSVTLNSDVYPPCNNSDLFNYTPLYFWEVSTDGGNTWQPVTKSAYNLTSKKITIGNTESDDGTVNPANQFYGYVDSVRVTKGIPRYTAGVISPYNPATATADLADNYTKLGVNLGSPGTRTVFSPVINVWTPSIGNAGNSQNIRVTTTPGINSAWDNLFPVRQSATFFGYNSNTSAVQFVTSTKNYVNPPPAQGSVAGGLGTHFNYLRITNSSLTVPYDFAVYLDDCCYEGYVRVRRFTHSYNDGAGSESIFIDARTNKDTADGICIYFTPQDAATGFVNVKIPNTTKILKYGPIANTVYYHIAVSKQFNTWRLYVGGILRDEITSQGASLNLTGLTTADNGTKYRVYVQLGALRAQYSNPATITVTIAQFAWENLGTFSGPFILATDTTTYAPAHYYTITPGLYTLRARAYINNISGGVFSYQWQTNANPITQPDEEFWQDIPGANGEVSNMSTGQSPTSVAELVFSNTFVLQTAAESDVQGWRVVVRCNDISSTSRVIITNTVPS
jgi:hypothetical protein